MVSPHPSFQCFSKQVTSSGFPLPPPSLDSYIFFFFVVNTWNMMHQSINQPYKYCIKFLSVCVSFSNVSWSQIRVLWNYLLLLVGVFPVVPMFWGLVRRWSLGRMCHCWKVVGYRNPSWNDTFHSCRNATWCNTHHAWWISRGKKWISKLKTTLRHKYSVGSKSRAMQVDDN